MPSPRAKPPASAPDLESRLRLKDLQLLVAIDEHRSVSAAAATLGIAQPAASRSLMELEQVLRTHLFERDRTRGMSPTPAGEVVLAHARSMLADCRLMQSQLDAQRTGAGLHLRLGVIPFAPNALVEHLVGSLNQPPAQVTMTITEGASTQLVRELQMQTLDAVLARSSSTGVPPDLGQELLLRQEACLVVHRKSPLAGKDSITARDFAAVRWLLPPRGTPTRYFIDEAFATAGMPPPHAVLEASTGRTVHAAVRTSPDLVAVTPSDVGKELEKLGGVLAVPWRNLPVSKPLKYPAIALLFPVRHKESAHIQLLLRELRRFIATPQKL